MLRLGDRLAGLSAGSSGWSRLGPVAGRNGTLPRCRLGFRRAGLWAGPATRFRLGDRLAGSRAGSASSLSIFMLAFAILFRVHLATSVRYVPEYTQGIRMR